MRVKSSVNLQTGEIKRKERLITKIMTRNYQQKLSAEIMRRNYDLVYYVAENCVNYRTNPKIWFTNIFEFQKKSLLLIIMFDKENIISYIHLINNES